MFSRFWPLRGWGLEGVLNPLKTENLVQKYFSYNVEWNSRKLHK